MNKLEPCQRIFCVVRNFHAHAAEMGDSAPDKPIFFMKPPTSLVKSPAHICLPFINQRLDHELELVIQLKAGGRLKTEAEAKNAIGAMGLGLDLTLRQVQFELKDKRWPWEAAKSFDGSAYLGPMVPFDESILNNLEYSLFVNDDKRQHGSCSDWIFTPLQQLVALSEYWDLLPGDLLYCGTPSGVGPLQVGDKVVAKSPNIPGFSTVVHEPKKTDKD